MPGTPLGEPPQSHERYAVVAWSVNDVLEMTSDGEGGPPAISEEQAREFLEDNERYIQDVMVERGWEAIEDLLRMDGLL
jgi:hypothetical protein